MKRSKISMSNLPSELLPAIGNRLETRQDILHFRAVCKDWHRSISISRISGKNVLSLFLPHKIPITNSPLLKGRAHFCDREDYNSLILVASSIFLVKAIENDNLLVPPWLITVDELNPGYLSLRKPFSRYAVKSLPEKFKNLGLYDYDVKEMGRVYSLWFDEKCCNNLIEGGYKFSRLFEEDHKVVLLGETRSKIDDCIAVVLYDSGTLAVVKLRDGKVEEVSSKVVKKFDDIVVFKGVVYAIDRRGRLYLMDEGCNDDGFKLLNIIQDPLKPLGERKSRLVESCGELYLVHKCCVSRPGFENSRLGFQVYMLNHEKNTWDEINSIGNDRILFVTPDCCFFPRVANFCGWKGNCIVAHSKHSFSSYNTRVSSDDHESYSDYFLPRDVDKQHIQVFHVEDFKFTSVWDTPYYSDVFWPPPPWISPDTCFPKVWFQGLYIRAKHLPTLEIIWAKYGDLIGPDTVRSMIVASALEELAQLVVNLKYITERKKLTSSLRDIKLTGIKVEWLIPIIDKAVILNKDKLIMESIKRLDRETAALQEKKREFLAQSAKLKEELKEDIDLDDFLEKVLQ